MFKSQSYYVLAPILILFVFLSSFVLNPVRGEHSVTASIPFQTGISDIAFNPDNNRLYVTEYGSGGRIFVIDTVTNSVINAITFPSGAHYLGPILFNPITHMLNVMDFGFDSQGKHFYQVTIINPSSNSIVTSIPVTDFPADIAVDSNNGNIYVTNNRLNTLSVISSSTNTVTATIPVNEPFGVEYNPSNHFVYVVNYQFNSNIGHVSVINPSTNAGIATIPVGDLPARGIAYNPVDGNMYVTNWRSSTISVIGSNTNNVIGTIPTVGSPDQIAYNPANGKMYVINKNAGSISVIESTTNSFVMETFKLTGGHDIAFNPFTSKIYVTNTFQLSVDEITETKTSGVCPTKNIQHWDKVIFKIVSKELAKKIKVPYNSELDIKVPDDPNKVADIKKKIIEFFKIPSANRSEIQIVNVDYAIICGEKELVISHAPIQQSKVIPSENVTATLLNMTHAPIQQSKVIPSENVTAPILK